MLHDIAGALYETLQYSNIGDLLTGTLMDHLCPTIGEMLKVTVMDCLIIPTPKTLSGAKGVGESTAQTAPAAVANAIADTMRHLGVEITERPVTPLKLCEQKEMRF
jgi:2-furoyl-CoA dehydrogenase large subunit